MFQIPNNFVLSAQELLKFSNGNITIDNKAFSEGFLVLSESSINMPPGTSMEIIKQNSSEESEIWIRIGFGPEGGTLKIDAGNQTTQLSTKASFNKGFQWIKVFSNMSQIDQIVLHSTGDGSSVKIDELAIIPSKILDRERFEVDQQISSAIHRVYLFSPLSPNIDTSEFQLDLSNQNSSNGHVLKSILPSELSFPLRTNSGEYYVYVRHDSKVTNSASFSIKIDNQTHTSIGVLENTTERIKIDSNNWKPGEFVDYVSSLEIRNLGTTVCWNLSDQTGGTNGFLYNNFLPINLESNNYAEINVLGDNSGNKLGTYLYDSNGKWIHFSFTNQKGIDWKGWRQIIFGLESYDSSSGNFDFSKVVSSTFEYSHSPNSSITQELRFTSFAFYDIKENTSDFKWTQLGPFEIKKEVTDVVLSANGPLWIDSIIITDVKNMTGIENLLFFASPLSDVNQRSKTRFSLPLQTNGHSLIIFQEAYHPLWKASFVEENLEHVLVNFAFNGFLIDTTSKDELHVWFEGDNLLEMGILISSITVSGLLIVVTIRKLIQKKSFRIRDKN